MERALARLPVYLGRGVRDSKYLLKLLARDVPKSAARLGPRPDPAPLAEAISAGSEEDEDNIAKARRPMHELLRMPRVVRGALMPDACPAGAAPATIPVGGAIAAEGAILPAAHSSDICCSVHCTLFRSGSDVAELLDAAVAATRFGPGKRPPDDRVHHAVIDEPVWGNPFLAGLHEHAAGHMADQGDGNHFVFLGKVEFPPAAIAALEAGGQSGLAATLRSAAPAADRPFESLALVTHHGSRGLGAQVFKRGHAAAIKHTAREAERVPDAAAWLDIDTPEGAAYWEALGYVGRWTAANHGSIHARFLERAGATGVAAFGNEHNFVWRRGSQFLHGKGATPAWRGEDGSALLGLIPLNMAEPVLVTLGRDNADYLSFSPHGAGRNRSRTATRKRYRDPAAAARALADSTRGIDVRWFCGRPDLSESPLGYKPAAQVKEQIAGFGLADVVAEIAPLGSVMAGEVPKRRRGDELTPKQLRQIGHRSERRKQRQRFRARGGWDADDE